MHHMSFLLVFILGSSLSMVSSTKYNTEPTQYTVPKPTIKAFISKGFSVSIPDSPGISLFAFHGNVNSELGKHNHLSKSVKQSQNGLWTFTDTSIKLKVGDIVNYWLYVEKDGLAYRQEAQQYVVDELHHNHQLIINDVAEKLVVDRSDMNRKESTVLSGNIHHYHHYPNDSPSSSPSSSSQCQSENQSYQLFEKITSQLNDVLIQLKSLHEESGPMKSKVDSLEEITSELLKQKYNGTKLLLLGEKRSYDSDAKEIIRRVISDELELHDLSTSIKNAEIVNASILFEMNGLIDKHRILRRAEKHFNSDQSKIVDFDIDDEHQSNSKIPSIFFRLGTMKMGDDKAAQTEDTFLFEK